MTSRGQARPGSDELPQSNPNLIVYRGPFQTSRLSLIVPACVRAFGPATFAWVSPTEPSSEAIAWADHVLRVELGINAWRLVDGRRRSFRSAVRSIREVSVEAKTVTAVGFSSVPYGRRLRGRRLIWCVNGIPEERLLYRRGLLDRAFTEATWAMARGGKQADLVVTVSKPMSELIQRRIGVQRTAEVPTAVDTGEYHPPFLTNRRYMTYLGSGAPWQGIDRLNEIWKEMARRRSDIRFRVASKDERTRALGKGISPNLIEFVRAEDQVTLARFLHEAILGFVVRSDHIVNRASFPTKIGQYLAAGVPVVSSDMEWDPADLLRGSGAGILVDPSAPPDRIAEWVLEALDSLTGAAGDTERRCVELAARLDRERWIGFLAGELARPSVTAALPVRP